MHTHERRKVRRLGLAALALAVAIVGWLVAPMPARAQDDAPPAGADWRKAANLLFMSLLNAPESAGAEEEDMMVVRVYFDTHEQVHDLVAMLDVFEEPTTGGYVTAYTSAADREKLAAAGYYFEIDAVKTADIAEASAAVASALQASAGDAINTIPGYSCYRTVEETYASLASIATANPNLATWTDIGNSWEKVIPGGKAGYDIYALVLTNKLTPGPKPKFFLMSAIHAREYTTAELATRFAEELVAKYNVDADVTWMLDNFEFHLVPQVNPDGRKLAEAGQLWRKNTDSNDGCRRSTQWGTDLNRNSSFKWNTGGSSGQACNETYRGPAAASEPETQAVEAYATAIFPDQRGPADTDPAPATAEGMFISLHSYSELVLFPWGWTTADAPNKTALQTLGRKFGFHNGYQVCNGPTCLYATSGTTDDYTYGKLGVASYTFELGTAFFQSCSTFTSNIIPKNMPALFYALKSARRPYQTPAGPDALNVAVSAVSITAGTPVNLTATANDTRYNSNGWGTEPTQTIQAARYSIDQPAWLAASTMTMAAADGSFNSTIENLSATIDTSGLASGRHTIFVEAQDAGGNWGPPTAVFLTIN